LMKVKYFTLCLILTFANLAYVSQAQIGDWIDGVSMESFVT